MDGDACKNNEDCINYITCNIKEGQTQGICEHDGLFPMDGFQILAYILIPFIVGIANVGGIGGGIVKVPILVLMLNYDTAQATNISYPITLGGCLANIFLLLREKHPTQDKPLIEFGIAMILVPAILLGTNTGVLMNNIMPEIFLNGFFIVFLCFVCPYLMKRGCGLLNLEMKVRKELKEINKEINNQSVLTQDIQIADIEKELIESKNDDLRKSILSQNPRIERYQSAVENLRKSVIERNSYFFDKQEMKDYRTSSMQRISGINERSKSSIQYTQFAANLQKNSNASDQERPKVRSSSINSINRQSKSVIQKYTEQEVDDSELLTEKEVQQRKLNKLNAKIIQETDLSLVPEQSIEQSMTMTNTDGSVIQNSNAIQQQIQQIKKIEEEDSRRETEKFFTEDNDNNNDSDQLVKKEEIQQQNQQITEQTNENSDIARGSINVSRKQSIQPIVYTDDQIAIKDKILAEEAKFAPLPKVLFLIGCLAVVSFFAFVLGQNSIFKFSRCDTGYWIFFGLQYVCLILLSLAAWMYMKKEINLKHSCHYDFDENDIQNLELSSYLKLSGSGAAAGFIAGMLGAGAGLVVVPVLLILNVHTRVAAATSGFMYFFISWASILTVITGGQLGMEIIGWYVMLALLGGAIISPIIYWLVNKYKRHSVVIFIVFFIAFLNIICSILYLFKAGGINGFDYLLKFHDYCKASH